MQPAPLKSAPQQRPTHVRHVVLALTVIAYMITYMDRVVISTAAPEMRKELGISLAAIGTSLSMFRLSYALDDNILSRLIRPSPASLLC